MASAGGSPSARSASVSAATVGRWAATPSGRARAHSSIRSSSSRLRLAAQVLDRPGQLACIALGDQLGRQLGVEHDDQPVVVRDRRPAAVVSPGSRPRPERASRRRVSPSRPPRTRPSPSRAAAITAGIAAPEPLPDPGEQRLDPTLDQRRVVVDDLDPLDVDLVRDQPQQILDRSPARGPAGRSTRSPAAGGS